MNQLHASLSWPAIRTTTKTWRPTRGACVSALAWSGFAIGLLVALAAYWSPAEQLLERLLVW